MSLHSIVNNILSSGTTLQDFEKARKIRILNIFHIIFIIVAPSLGVFYLYVGADLLFFVTHIGAVFMLTSMLLLRKTQNMMFMGNYAVAILWATLFVIAWNTGAITYDGVIRPSWILNGGLILLAIFFNSYLGGTIWATIVFMEIGLVIYLFRIGYQFPNLIPSEISTVYSLGSYMVCLLVILSLAFLFEREKEDMLNREQEQARALKKSKRYIDDILARSPIPTFILDNNHRVVQWNSACEDITGLPAQNILGMEIWEGFTVNDQGSMADFMLEDVSVISERFKDSIISHTETGWFELDMFLPKFKGGKRVMITAAPILDNDGSTMGAIQTIQEVDSAYLGKSGKGNAFLGKENEVMTDPIFKLDMQGNISFWNKACEECFGFVSSDMLGNNPLTFVAKQYRPIFKDALVQVLKGESFRNKEFRYQSAEGKPIFVLAKVYPIQGSDGEIKECVFINTDITELRLRLRQFRLSAAETKEQLKNITEEYDLLKKNIATFIRKKEGQP
ncbi:MAG: PAS domain S-box protein [Deltaproteobacteria bacterium]|nr:PAS domain S-box protein [Deltaproteobacteria bacterium]